MKIDLRPITDSVSLEPRLIIAIDYGLQWTSKVPELPTTSSKLTCV
jgi:hypothetical protein